MSQRFPIVVGVVAGATALIVSTASFGITTITFKLCGPDPCPPSPEYGFVPLPLIDIHAVDLVIAVVVGVLGWLIAIAAARLTRGGSETGSRYIDDATTDRSEAPWPRLGIAMALVVACVVAVYVFWVGPSVDQIFRDVADDYCPRFSSGEPDRRDPDCYGSLGGGNPVEEWDRRNPSP